MNPEIKVYSLSNCDHCSALKEYLEALAIPHDYVYVDRLFPSDRNAAMDDLRRLNPFLTFPTIVIGDVVLVGFDREKVEAALKQYGLLPTT